MFTQREIDAFSLSRAVRSIAHQQFHGSLEMEMLADAATRANKPMTPSSTIIPWELLGRRASTHSPDFDMLLRSQSRYQTRSALAAENDGGNIVGENMMAAIDALRGRSMVADLGADVVKARGDVTMPQATTGADAYWLADEFTAINLSRPTVGTVSAAPKTCGSVIAYTKLLELAALEVEHFLEQHLLKTISRALDLAAVSGSGLNGEPQGIIGATGVQAISLAGDPAAAIANALEAVENSEARPSGFAVGTALAKTLRRTPVLAGGSTPIMAANTIDGKPAIVGKAAPDSTALVGEFNDLCVVLFGSGPSVGVDPSTYFDQGILQMRCLLHVDIAVRRASSFAVIS